MKGLCQSKRCVQNSTSPTIPSKSLLKDVISKLPDEILQFIISSLSMREGAATCILSKRWRSLWTSAAYHLDFDIPTMLGHSYPQDMFQKNDIHPSKPSRLLKKKRYEFTQWVDRVLHLRSASRLDSLRVCFVLNNQSAACIDGWIKSALAQGVTNIVLDFSVYDFFGFPPISRPHFYRFPTTEDASSLKYLTLKFCIFHLPPDLTGFGSLISLSLDFMDVTQHLVDNILSSCHLLECPSLKDCWYPNKTNLTFSGPSLLLKHLHIRSASLVEKIEVHDINLISLEVIGWSSQKLSLKNAPQLARLVLFESVRVETLSNVPRLEILFLRQQWEMNYDNSGLTIQSRDTIPSSRVFSNLRRLVFVNEDVRTNFVEVVCLLETCPNLQELELNMCSLQTPEEELTETMSKLSAVPRIHHNNLKEVEINGFEPHPERIAFAKYMLNYASVLEKMKIYTTRKGYQGNDNWTLHEGSTNQEKSLKEVQKQLQKIARSSTKLELSSSVHL